MKKYELVLSSRFKKDLKQCVRRNFDISNLDYVVEILISGNKLPEKYRDYNLKGNWNTHRECHIEPDWILMYRIDNDLFVLILTRTGTHSDLFG